MFPCFHGWRDGLARKNLHEVLDLLTSIYNRNDWQIAYSVCFYILELENWGNRRVKVENVQVRRILFVCLFSPSFLAQI